MATALDLIDAALTELNVLAAGETSTAGDALAGLAVLNRLIDQWAAERLQIYTVTRSTWTITSNDGSYTVGSGGDVNIVRPVYIDHVNYIDTTPDPDTEYQLQMLTEDAYSNIPQKALTSTLPTSAYYNPTFPLGALTLWPVPTSSTLQGVLYAPTAVAQIAAVSTSVSLPPGYSRMIVKNLAIELAPSYSRQLDQLLYRQAMEAKEVVKRSNTRLSDLSFEQGALIGSGRLGWDIRVG